MKRQPFTPRRQLKVEPAGGGGRLRPFAKFLAYEGCFQICLTAIGTSPSQPEALHFVQSRCAVLKGGFGLSSDMLPVAAQENEPPVSVGVEWIYKSANVDQDPLRDLTLPVFQQPPQKQIQQPRPVSTTQSAGVLRSTVRVTASRLVPLDGTSSPGKKPPGSSWVEPPQQQAPLKIGYSWRSLFGLPQPSVEPLNVVLQARGHDPLWVSFDPSGHGQGLGEYVELGPDETHGQLQITLQSGRRFVAGGATAMQQLWQLAETPSRPSHSPRRPKTKSQSLIDRLAHACISRSVADSNPMQGSVWVNMADDHGRRPGSVLISAWLGSRMETTTTMTQPMFGGPLPAPPPMPFNTFNSYSMPMASQAQEQAPVTTWEAYDCLLAAAIHSEGGGRGKLAIQGDWQWLLTEFAATYGVRSTYASLAYLGWLVRADVISSTTDCLQLLTQHLKLLKAAEAHGALLIEEVALLKSIVEAALGMLARCFEKYYAVSNDAATGILDGNVAATESPAPVLHQAVLLAGSNQPGIVRTGLSSARDGPLMMKSYQLSHDVNAVVYNPDMGEVGQEDFLASYAQLEGLCHAMMSELASDRRLHDCGILPRDVCLPQITAAQYCKLFCGKLRGVMARAPPPEPSSAVINLMIGVGNFQAYLEWEGLLPLPESPAAIDAYTTFQPHVQQWINSSQAKLLQTCQALEGSRGSGPMSYVAGEETGRGAHSPLLLQMLHSIETELQRYERIVNYWPVYAPQLESAVCTVLRAVTAAVTRQCGLMPTTCRPATSFGRTPVRLPERQVFQWHQPPQVVASPISPQARRTPPNRPNTKRILPFEAVLLNSLRHLLTFVPETNDLLTCWARTTADSPGRKRLPTPAQSPSKVLADQDAAPLRGALFDQLVKELRSEYAAAVTACATCIHTALAEGSGSIQTALDKYGVSGDPSIMQEQVHPTLELLEDVMADLYQAVDSRVFVSVGRGLWDCASQDVYDYLEGLQEGLGLNKGAWRGRQSASAVMSVVDSFFTATLSATLQHEIHERDLDLPLHSDRTHKLLADNTTAVNMSYTVY